MKELINEINDLELSIIPISIHIKELKDGMPSIFYPQFEELEDKIVEMKRIIGTIRTCGLPHHVSRKSLGS